MLSSLLGCIVPPFLKTQKNRGNIMKKFVTKKNAVFIAALFVTAASLTAGPALAKKKENEFLKNKNRIEYSVDKLTNTFSFIVAHEPSKVYRIVDCSTAMVAMFSEETSTSIDAAAGYKDLDRTKKLRKECRNHGLEPRF